MLRACIGWFGADSKNWIGRRVHLFLKRVETVNPKTGETKVRVQRGMLCQDPHVRSRIHARRLVTAPVTPGREREPGTADDAPSCTKDTDTAHEPDVSAPIDAHDHDDIDLEARPFARRRG
jgi:hypothetical protein